DQEFGGIGLELGIDDQTRALPVLAPLPGSPAWRAGILAGDRIEAIDGQSTAGLPIREAVRRLRGRPGDPVRLRVVSAAARGTLDAAAVETARDVPLVREVVKVESVLGDRRRPDGTWEWFVADEPGVAIVRITSFGDHTVADLDAALEAIKRQAGDGLRGLVVDLRGNPGGLLSAACETCDRFLDEGVIVSTAGRRSGAGAGDAATTRRAEPGVALPGVPLAVLVDGLTASAAEIVAACLQDHHRATIVGSRTFGKGTVQSILPLSDGRSLLKLTTSEYLRPSRVAIHRRPGDSENTVWGVSPDPGFEIAPTAEQLERTRRWRRARDLADQGPAAAASPRDADPVLALAVRQFSRPTAATDLRGQEETAGHTDEAPPRRE
ncbi:MAG: S41 family peptidase, partial [Planctomycetia bacterium]